MLYRTDERNPIVQRKGEIPECPAINVNTREIEYLDLNDENLDNLNNYIPLADLYLHR